MRRLENVLKDPPKVDPRNFISIDAHRTISKIQGPNVVQSKNMIDVAMCYQHGVKPIDLSPESLLPKINRSIDKNFLMVMLDQDGDAEAFVTRIVGQTGLAVASYRRNAGGGACTEEGELHVRRF